MVDRKAKVKSQNQKVKSSDLIKENISCKEANKAKPQSFFYQRSTINHQLNPPLGVGV